MKRVFKRHILVLTSVAVLLGIMSEATFAHARLIKSQPAASALLSKAPSKITLWFSEQPENDFSTVELFDAQKTRLTLGALTSSADKSLTVPIAQSLAPGVYRVRYRVLSQDGHIIKASFKFTVNPVEAR